MSVGHHQIGLLEAISYVVGVIGAALYIAPRLVVRKTHSVGAALLVWTVAGVFSTCGAFTYVELGTFFRSSGADFSYFCLMGWHSTAFASIVVCTFICYPAIVAVQLQAFSSYLLHAFDVRLDPRNEFIARKLIETTLLWLIAFINCFSLRKVVGKFNTAAALAKIAVIGCVVVVGLTFLVRGHVENFRSPFAGTRFVAADYLEAMAAALFTFDGFDVLSYGTQEIRNPKRTMPLAIGIGMSIVSAVYLASNCAYFAVLDLERILESDAPIAADFAERALGSFAFLIPLFICVLMVGAINATIFSASRSIQAGAQRGFLPTFLSLVHYENESPRAAIVIHSLLVMIPNSIGQIDQLINISTFSLWLQRCVTCLILFRLRLQQRAEGPPSSVVRVPLIIPIVFFGSCILLVGFFLATDFRACESTVVLIFVALLVHFFLFKGERLKRESEWMRALNFQSTKIAQILVDGVPQTAEIRRAVGGRVQPKENK